MCIFFSNLIIFEEDVSQLHNRLESKPPPCTISVGNIPHLYRINLTKRAPVYDYMHFIQRII